MAWSERAAEQSKRIAAKSHQNYPGLAAAQSTCEAANASQYLRINDLYFFKDFLSTGARALSSVCEVDMIIPPKLKPRIVPLGA